MNLKSRKMLLTGATGGIGSATAILLSKEGARLLLVGRDQNKLTYLIKQLEGNHHTYVVADLLTQTGRQALTNAASQHQADTLINCMGTNSLACLAGMQDDEIENIIATNLLAPMAICKNLLPILLTQKNAVIMNIGSILGSIGYAGSSVYCASKFGLRGFTEALRRELANQSVRVIYFAPRATNTELNNASMKALNRSLGITVDEPEAVARELLKTLNDTRAKNRYLGWPESFFVRLNSVVPNLVDKALFKQLPIIHRYANK